MCMRRDGRVCYMQQHRFSMALTPPWSAMRPWKHKTKQVRSVFQVRRNTPEQLSSFTVQSDVWKRTGKPSRREASQKMVMMTCFVRGFIPSDNWWFATIYGVCPFPWLSGHICRRRQNNKIQKKKKKKFHNQYKDRSGRLMSCNSLRSFLPVC